MALSNRVEMLRQLSLDTPATLSAERAELITKFYESDNGVHSTAVRRALSFRYLMEQKELYIGDGELIVGERGPAPKATPTFPEICCHTVEDLDVLDSREKVSYAVSDEVRAKFRNYVTPFW